MDMNDFRSLLTLVLLLVFVGVCWWAYGSKRKARFDQAANLPFSEDEEKLHAASVEEADK